MSPYAPGPMTDHLQDLHHEKGKIVDRFEHGVRSQFDVTCAAGCSGCCHQVVMVQPFEAALIASTLGPGDIAAVVSQGSRQIAAMDRLPLEQGVLAWLQRAEPCVFLRDNKCSIYEVAPATCRLFMTDGDARLCAPDAAAEVQRVDATPELALIAEMERRWRGSPCWGIMGVMIALELGRMDTMPAGVLAHGEDDA